MSCLVRFEVSVIGNTIINDDDILWITGSPSELGSWDLSKAIRMELDNGKWIASISVSHEDLAVEYKYFSTSKYETSSPSIRAFETLNGRNRTIPQADILLAVKNNQLLTRIDVLDAKCGTYFAHNSSELRIRFGLGDKPDITLFGTEQVDFADCALEIYLRPCTSSQEIARRFRLDLLQESSSSQISIMKNLDYGLPVSTILADEAATPASSKTFAYFAIEMSSLSELRGPNHYIEFTFTHRPTNAQIAKATLLPAMISRRSSGEIQVPMMSVCDNMPIGMMTVNYLWLLPFQHENNNLKFTFGHRSDQISRMSTHEILGHRGYGAHDSPHYSGLFTENTLNSFLRAHEAGADFVEFDVHLSRDGIPVIYHDFALKTKIGTKTHNANVGAFSVEELHELPMSNTGKSTHRFVEWAKHLSALSKNDGRWRERLLEMEKFNRIPTLANMFEELPGELGFDIEVKYPNDYRTQNMWVDRNEFVDTILKVVFEENNVKSGRRIFFSSFDADICALLKKKQARYPVLFLTRARKIKSVDDPRGWSIGRAIMVAQAEEILGVVANCVEVLDKEEVGEMVKKFKDEVVFFTYGRYNDSCRKVNKQKQLGVRGFCTDSLFNFAK